MSYDIGSPTEMDNIPKTLRDELSRNWTINRASLVAESRSSDGSTKILLRFDKETSVEVVHLPSEKRTTLCLSSQTGCLIGCLFCATARLNSARSLSIGEMTEQFFAAVRSKPQGAGLEKPTHLVFMGMGEPLLSPQTLIETIRILTWEHGPEFSQRRITVSTCGIVKGIRLLADSGLKPGLALSLNAPTEMLRKRLMPKAPPLSEVIPAMRYYAKKTGRRVTLEYVLLENVNDSTAQASALASLSRSLPCKINLIPFNPFPGSDFRRPAEGRIRAFVKTLLPAAPAVTLRQSMGTDIMAACGQLAGAAYDTAPERNSVEIS